VEDAFMTEPAPPAEAGVSDGALVRAVIDGDHDSLGALYDRYGRPAYALARRITGSTELAEDVVQDVFVGLWRDPARYDPARAGFPAWLLATTHHLALDATRRHEVARREREALADETTDRVAHSVEASAGPLGDRTCRALGALPPTQQQAVILAYFAGHTQREIAADTDAPLSTVQARMVNGMRQLRVLLDGSAGTTGGQP
jgi:RNA polymerase sigma factor (sigma-70 family)